MRHFGLRHLLPLCATVCLLLHPTAAHASWSSDAVVVTVTDIAASPNNSYVTSDTIGGNDGNVIVEAGVNPGNGDGWANGSASYSYGSYPVIDAGSSSVSYDVSQRFIKGSVSDPDLTITAEGIVTATASTLYSGLGSGGADAKSSVSVTGVDEAHAHASGSNELNSVGPGAPYAGQEDHTLTDTSTVSVSVHCEGSIAGSVFGSGGHFGGSYGATASVNFYP